METGPSAWWDQSWNPTAGCAPVDPDCANCYAAKQAGTIHQRAGAKREVRLLYDGITDLIDGRPVFNGRTTRLPPGHPSWSFPLIYPGAYRPVLGPNRPSLIFVGDMSDLFFRQPTRIIDKVVGTIAASPHIGLLLTRRAGRMRAYFTAPRTPLTLRRQQDCLWLGASAGFQAAFDARWPHLRTLAERGWLVFISVAPLREAVRLPPGSAGPGRPRMGHRGGRAGCPFRLPRPERQLGARNPRSMRERRCCILLQAAEPQGSNPNRFDDSTISTRGATALLVNIRGTHGSGKSTAIRALMEKATFRPIYDVLFGPRHPEGYVGALPGVSVPIFVIGPYTTDCGGCDRIPRNATVMALIRKYAERGHVLFEGSLISSAYGAVGKLMERWGKDLAFVFLDTPLEECLQRVEARRGRERDERLIRNVTSKYDAGWRVHQKVVSEGKMRAISHFDRRGSPHCGCGLCRKLSASLNSFIERFDGSTGLYAARRLPYIRM